MLASWVGSLVLRMLGILAAAPERAAAGARNEPAAARQGGLIRLAGGTFAPGASPTATPMLGLADEMTGVADMSWQDRAACRGANARLFFGPDGERPQDREIREAKAKAICVLCPVRELCLDYALRNSIKHGIWGGLNREERTRERRRRTSRPRAA